MLGDPSARRAEPLSCAGARAQSWPRRPRRRGDRAALRLARPPGRLRRGRPVPLRRRRRAAARRRRADRRARRGPGPAEPRRDLPQGRVRRRDRRRDPRAAPAEVTPAVCKASAGAVEHLAIARVRNLADFLADAKARGRWMLRRRRRTRARPTRAPDYRGKVVLVLGSEGQRAAPAGRRPPATSSSRCRCAAGSSRSTSAPPPRCCCTTILQQRGLTRPHKLQLSAL